MTDISQKTVYFLGAGASNASDFHLPTMGEFFKGANFAGEEYQNLKRFIKDKFPGLPIENLNLEEVVTAIELSMDTFGSFGERSHPYIYGARTEFDTYVNARLKIPEYKPCSLLIKIFDKDKEKPIESVITLNYDLIIENCISARSYKIPGPRDMLGRMDNLLGQPLHSDIRQNFSLPYEEANSRLYLKLHGSIDWFYCPNPDCGFHQQFFPNRNHNIFSSPVRIGDLCRICGSPVVTAIVPPTMYKTFEKFPKMGLLWNLAYHKLNIAEKIVIFGVSFAPSDYYLRWLFKKAITDRKNKPTIINIDSTPQIGDKIKEITGIAPEHFPTLDEYLAKQ